MSAHYVEHARKFGLARTLRYAAWRSRDLLVGYTPWTCFTLPGRQPLAARPVEGIDIREIALGELAAYCPDPDYDLSERAIAVAREKGDRCVGAFAGPQLVAYAFGSVVPTRFDGEFEFAFPRGWVYGYKAYTLPAWRGRGIHACVLSARHALMCPPSGTSVSLVMSMNLPSMTPKQKAGLARAFEFAIVGKEGDRRLTSSDPRCHVDNSGCVLGFRSGDAVFSVAKIDRV